jgi:alkylhydroperoxidase/carboxymuconolactone decarboxylase family protein YurZ
MTISQAAQRNHDQLFPNQHSTLRVSDPELVEIFDNWAFDEVIADAPLDVRLRLMVQLSALIAAHAVGEYGVMLDAALNVGVTPVEIKEILYQAVPYVGLGRVFDFLHATNTLFKSRNIALPVEAQSTTTPEPPDRDLALDLALPRHRESQLPDNWWKLLAEREGFEPSLCLPVMPGPELLTTSPVLFPFLGYTQTCHILSGGPHKCHQGGWGYGTGTNTTKPNDCG